MEARRIELVVTDLDGTLWDGTCRAHPLTLAALSEVSAILPVIAATGRRPSSAYGGMRENGFTLPAVLFDGALGLLSENGTIFHHRSFEADLYHRILEIFLGSALEPVVNLDDPRSFGTGQSPSTHPRHLTDNAQHSRMIDLTTVLSVWNVFSFLICGGDDRLANVFEAVRHIASASLTPDTRYGGLSLSVRPMNATKWSGVSSYCRRKDIDTGRILAVADGMNDLDLLSAASVACVPESACDEALRLATHVIPNPSDGGWTHVLGIARETASLLSAPIVREASR